jgi:hypothetical protein
MTRYLPAKEAEIEMVAREAFLTGARKSALWNEHISKAINRVVPRREALYRGIAEAVVEAVTPATTEMSYQVSDWLYEFKTASLRSEDPPDDLPVFLQVVGNYLSQHLQDVSAAASQPMPFAFSSMRWPITSANFMRTLAIPTTAQPWSLTSLREKLIKIGAKVVSHGRYVTFQMAEVAVSTTDVRRHSVVDRRDAATARIRMTRAVPLATGTSEGEVCLRTSKSGAFQRQSTSARGLDRPWLAATANCRCPSR